MLMTLPVWCISLPGKLGFEELCPSYGYYPELSRQCWLLNLPSDIQQVSKLLADFKIRIVSGG